MGKLVKNQVHQQTPTQKKHEDNVNLSGTFISVSLLALFLIVSWGFVFLLFMNRG